MMADINVFSPPLPGEVVHTIFSLLMSDIGGADFKAVCSAACVCPSWRAAAMEPSLWSDLGFSDRSATRPRADQRRARPESYMRVNVTDAQLLRCVERAAGGLKSLCVKNCWALSLRGVAAALAGQQEGSLARLWIEGIQTSEEGDDDEESFAALQAAAEGPLDVLDYAPCTAVADEDAGEDMQCGRLCIGQLCMECDISRCSFCIPMHDPLCEHVCFQCLGGGPHTTTKSSTASDIRTLRSMYVRHAFQME